MGEGSRGAASRDWTHSVSGVLHILLNPYTDIATGYCLREELCRYGIRVRELQKVCFIVLRFTRRSQHPRENSPRPLQTTTHQG
jgi:hypothetical protein